MCTVPHITLYRIRVLASNLIRKMLLAGDMPTAKYHKVILCPADASYLYPRSQGVVFFLSQNFYNLYLRYDSHSERSWTSYTRAIVVLNMIYEIWFANGMPAVQMYCGVHKVVANIASRLVGVRCSRCLVVAYTSFKAYDEVLF